MLYSYRLAGLITALVLMHLGASPVAAQERESFPAAQADVPVTARDSIIAVVDESLRAMAANDVAASRALMLPDGVEFATQETPEGVRIRGRSNEEYLEWLAQNEDLMLERIWDPTVQVHGAIATLWAPYALLAGTAMICYCGSPFDLDSTPNLRRALDDRGLEWAPPSPLRFPDKSW